MSIAALKLTDAGFDRPQVEAILSAVVGEQVTKSDLLATEHRLEAQISLVDRKAQERDDRLEAELKAEISSVHTELKAEIASVRTELKAEIAAVRTELKAEIAAVRTELKAEIAAAERRLIERIARVEGEFVTMRWMGGLLIALVVGVLVKQFFP